MFKANKLGLIVIVIINILAVISHSVTTSGEPSSPQFEISYPPNQIHNHNHLKITPNPSETLIEVYSQSGIGRAEIKPHQHPWTKPVIIRLYLQGLEGFLVSNNYITLSIEQLKVQAFNQQGEPINAQYLLNEAGYYEITLPDILFVNNLTEIKLQWIDFYR